MRCVNCDLKKSPTLKKEEIDTLITQKSLNKSTLYNFGSRHSIETEKYCFGHLLADFCWHLISYLLKKDFNLRPVDKEVINRLIIRRFLNHISTDQIQYYKRQFV